MSGLALSSSCGVAVVPVLWVKADSAHKGPSGRTETQAQQGTADAWVSFQNGFLSG